MKKTIMVMISILVLSMVVLSSCAPAATATPEKVVETVVVEKQVEKVVQETVVVEKQAEDPAAAAREALAGKKMAGILSGAVNDAGWNTQAYQAMVAARDTFGLEIAYTENTKVEDAPQVMRDYADAGYDIIFAHGYEYADQIAQVAKEYPDLKFIQTNGSTGDIPNLYTITLSTGEGGYFMGRLACQITKTGKITIIGAEEFPIWSHHIKMFRQACTDIGSTATVSEAYVGSWNDPAKAKQLAAAAIADGSDVLVTNADAGDTGTIEAAKEAVEKGNTDLRVIGWVKDKNHLGPSFVIGGWTEDITAELRYVLQEKIATGAPGGHFAIGMKEGAAYMNPTYGLVPKEVEDDVVKLIDEYLKDPKAVPNLVVRTDL